MGLCIVNNTIIDNKHELYIFVENPNTYTVRIEITYCCYDKLYFRTIQRFFNEFVANISSAVLGHLYSSVINSNQ